jgi:hypothetical protein
MTIQIRSVFLAFLLLILAACSGRVGEPVPTVHIFSNQPDHPGIEALVDALDQAGFEQRISYRETPGGLEVGETVLVHPAGVRGFNQGQQLVGLVSESLGQRPETKTPGHGNHVFTAGNLGLYIYFEGRPENSVIVRLHKQFAGSCGPFGATLSLFDDFHFDLEIERWDGSRLVFDAYRRHQGSWQGDGSTLALDSVDGQSWSGPIEERFSNQPVLTLDGPDELAGCRLMRPL